jgi:hypothetical protein
MAAAITPWGRGEMTLRGRVINLAKRAIGRGGMDGSFDGLNGVSVTGWLREGNGGAVTLLYGDTIVAQGRANLPRNDLAAAGIQGAGFAVPVDALNKAVVAAVENGEIEPCVIRATSLSGSTLGQTTAPISPSHLMVLLALSIAVNVMEAPNLGDPIDLY